MDIDCRDALLERQRHAKRSEGDKLRRSAADETVRRLLEGQGTSGNDTLISVFEAYH